MAFGLLGIIQINRQRIEYTSELIQTLNEMYQLSYKMFLNSLNIHATRLLDKVRIEKKKNFNKFFLQIKLN